MLARKWIIALLIIISNVSYAKIEPGIYTEDKLSIVVNHEQPHFVIRLKSNPTTGYSWFLREYDRQLITPVKHTYEAPNSRLMGAPGYDVWTFAVKPTAFAVPQMTQLRFTYARPWEVNGQVKQIVFKVTTN